MAIEVAKIYTRDNFPDIFEGPGKLSIDAKVHELGIGAHTPVIEPLKGDPATVLAIAQEDGSVQLCRAGVASETEDKQHGTLRTYMVTEHLKTLVPGAKTYTFYHRERDEDIGGTVIVRNIGDSDTHPISTADPDQSLPYITSMN